MPDCSVIVKTFSQLDTRELYEIVKLRTDVFLVEQKVDDEELDRRDLEPLTEHYWIEADSGSVAAYLRLLHDETPQHRLAHRVIGRVVTRPDHRGRGLALRLVSEVIARHAGEDLVLHAQDYVRGLYAKAGFEAYGEVYQEAGIPHIGMYRAAD